MSDSEEDYMSDKFVASGSQNDVRPSLLYRKGQKRSLEIYKKEQEQRKKPKPQEIEKERLEAGLQTAISADNKGFKMLEKMGYKPGTGLGKSDTGIKEPVVIKLKASSSGLGREQHLKEVAVQKTVVTENYRKMTENQFLEFRTRKVQTQFLRGDIYRARHLCENLDMQKSITYPVNTKFWRKSTIEEIKKKMKKKDDDDDSDSSSSSSDEEELESQPLLNDLVTYLRTTYNYCMYCGNYLDNDSECPGFFRSAHD